MIIFSFFILYHISLQERRATLVLSYSGVLCQKFEQSTQSTSKSLVQEKYPTYHDATFILMPRASYAIK